MSDPSTTHDPQDDYDDSFGVPARKPSTVLWASHCWMIFSLINVPIFVVSGWLAFTGTEFSLLDRLLFGLLVVFFGVLGIGFNIISDDANLSRSATLVRSLVWSWSVIGIFVLTGLALVFWQIYSRGFARLTAKDYVLVTMYSAYVLPALIGSILATVGRKDYQAWKNRRAGRKEITNDR